ncbi:hypothetical protein NDU88_002050 [Pleurodeles waltl]|uniref:Uncharacterized protein n=1 Tax=Pleurodeles waltl TaxID=8319 RepID=A0AAV7T236_PLEWA|nr:hypothetical protein NDU88_002050 [Pleurodeles waltl]
MSAAALKIEQALGLLREASHLDLIKQEALVVMQPSRWALEGVVVAMLACSPPWWNKLSVTEESGQGHSRLRRVGPIGMSKTHLPTADGEDMLVKVRLITGGGQRPQQAVLHGRFGPQRPSGAKGRQGSAGDGPSNASKRRRQSGAKSNTRVAAGKGHGRGGLGEPQEQ